MGISGRITEPDIESLEERDLSLPRRKREVRSKSRDSGITTKEHVDQKELKIQGIKPWKRPEERRRGE